MIVLLTAMSKVLAIMMMAMMSLTKASSINYTDALAKSILYFEGQRSGKLPPSQRMTWRKDSALQDGSDIHMDLVGGYYDAGDNVKFNFPMAFTTTMLAWSVLEFGDSMGSELPNALEAIRWGTDYFLKATKTRNIVVTQVGDPNLDHDCWERPEDMDTLRTSYYVTPQKPGSEVSAEIAAALTASSIVFRKTDAHYSKFLLDRASRVFDFANQYRGSYNDSVGAGACPFYCDFSGYMDELIWAAAWLYKATDMVYYRDYVKSNIQSIAPTTYQFGWDCKTAGVNILVSQWAMADSSAAPLFIPNADNFICSLLPSSPIKSVSYSKGGLMFKPGECNLQHATTWSFILIVYARYMGAVNKTIPCSNEVADPSRLISLAKSQADYILGDNPLGLSYMVGYGDKYPEKVHHRGSTLPSIDVYPQSIKCRDGDIYFKADSPNPNILTGAVVGGPYGDDSFNDSRYNADQTEPPTYNTAPFVGVLAYFKQAAIAMT